jgi:fructokinase
VKVFGCIEAGGTKFVCGVGTGPKDLRVAAFPTRTPGETLRAVVEYLRREGGPELAAVGIGSFGPVDLDPNSPAYGHITSTPKTEWANCDLVGAVKGSLGLPVGFDTDVNAAALGEARWGAAQDVGSCLYLTFGTGVGGGYIADGRLLHGMLHPEMGHIRPPRDPASDPFPGVCPYHGDCLEGLASGPAIEKRWGKPAADLPPDHPAWALEARYIALALTTFVCTLSPGRIILGGGVMKQEHLFDPIRSGLAGLLNGYVRSPEILERMDRYVVPPGLGDRSGVLGALALAEAAAQESGIRSRP